MRSVLLGLLIPVMSASAQAYLISPGSRVRIMKASERYEPRRTGRVVSIVGDSAVIRFDWQPPVGGTFPLTRLERWNGTRTKAREGTIKGAIIGGGIAFGIATAISSAHCGDAMFCIPRRGAQRTLTPPGLLLGMAIGRARGSNHIVDRWTPLI